jgi:TolB-like protein
MVGETLSHYRILRRIGAGGMGVVYLAHDERLDRDVALKVLAADVLADPSAAPRFRREAHALSRLNHPNIAAVYDFDTQAGVSFLAMEHVAGRSVSDIAEQGPVADPELVNLALQLADGLVAAHREGVVHRDLKPGNLRLTADGRLKILDFGLAKFTGPASADGATQTALETQGVVGTLPYMAPEQLRGAPVDARTDIYAAGVVLYELATGRRPFTEPVTAALIDGILHAAPIAPGRVRPELSPVLEGIIVKCLEKDPGFRYQSAAELLADLKRYAARSTAQSAVSVPASVAAPIRPRRAAWQVARVALPLLALAAVAAAMVGFNPFRVRDVLLGGGPERIESLAVLPFDNFSHDPSQQYFVDGMTETLTTHLAQITSIRVVGRTSVQQFAGARKPIPEIADVLKVDAVVEGSVLRQGSRVRITAQLVAANPERHLWANTYDRDLKDILEVHSEVSQAIAREIRATLSPDERSRLARTRAVNPEAYQAYLHGRQALLRMGDEASEQAEIAFGQAIALDPTFAPAYSSLAFMRLWAGVLRGGSPPRTVASRVRAVVAKALELDPSLGEALAVEGTLNLYFDWDWATAAARLKRALEVSPSEPLLYHPYADYLLVQGKLEESLEYCRRGAALDPLSPAINGVVAGHLAFLRRWDEAIAVLDHVREANPDVGLLRGMKADALWGKGDFPAAIAEWTAMGGRTGETLKRGYAEAGPQGAARAVARMLVEASASSYVSPYGVAEWYARSGDTQPAIQWLEKAYEDRSPFLLHMKADPAFEVLRRDERFQDIVRRIGFPEPTGETHPARRP